MSALAALDFPTLLARAAQRGRSPALSFYRGKALEGRLSYRELVARVEALAGALHEQFGVRAGDRVALLAPNRLEVPVLMLAPPKGKSMHAGLLMQLYYVFRMFLALALVPMRKEKR